MQRLVVVGASAAADAQSSPGRHGGKLRAPGELPTTTVDCDGGANADKADLDLLPKDPNSKVTGCETKTRH